MNNQIIPNAILSSMIALAAFGISSDAEAGDPCECKGYCGDGIVQEDHGEVCDGTPHCGDDCKPEPYCGDGTVDPGETCDGGPHCDDCCEPIPYCGDGHVNGNEQCDGGKNCNKDCTFCEPPAPPPSCKKDKDHDGVKDCHDMCPHTKYDNPTMGLGVNRFALIDDNDGDKENFDTVKPKGKGPERSYTTEDTAGCSCEQIIEMLDLGKGHEKHGCSISAMDEWVAHVADSQAAPIGGGGLEVDQETPEETVEAELELDKETVEEVLEAELDLPGETPAYGCNMGGQTRNAPAWAFLGLVLAAIGRRRRRS
jgi:MYXO-CTERM domain-containing protein